MSEDRIRRLEQNLCFWKRYAAVVTSVLVLVCLAFICLTVTLYTSLVAERDRVSQERMEAEMRARDAEAIARKQAEKALQQVEQLRRKAEK